MDVSSSAFTLSSARSPQIIAYSSRSTSSKRFGVFYFRSSGTLPSLAFSRRETTCPKLQTNGSHLLKAVPVQSQARAQEAQAQAQQGIILPATKKNDVLFRFLRPFAMSAASIQFSTVLTRRLMENPHLFKTLSSLPMFIKIHAVLACIACTCFFTSGINQIFDIETDRINKPDLPLSTGELSIDSAWLMMLSFVAISLVIAGALNSVPFLVFNFGLLIVGAVYSVPPFRFKASTIGAPTTIAFMQGFVHFLTMFAGAGAALGLPFQMSPPIVYMAIFTTIFSTSQGILKDISDVEGDRESNIPTLATKIGVKKTLMLGVGIHILNHLGWVLAALIRPTVLKSSIMIPAHIIGALYVIHQAWKITQINYEPTQSRKLYFSMWRSYYLQFITLPFL